MDISNLGQFAGSILASQNEATDQKIGVAVLKKSIDSQSAAASSLLQVLDGVGKNVDQKA